jgi:hypothetical protein
MSCADSHDVGGDGWSSTLSGLLFLSSSLNACQLKVRDLGNFLSLTGIVDRVGGGADERAKASAYLISTA